MAMVAAFAVSAHATQVFRVAKPFDALLGETYECDRSDDLGWRCFSEQVSNSPPTVAQGTSQLRSGDRIVATQRCVVKENE